MISKIYVSKNKFNYVLKRKKYGRPENELNFSEKRKRKRARF